MNKILKYALIIVCVLAILGITASVLLANPKNKKRKELINAQNDAVQQTSKSKTVANKNNAGSEVYKGKPNSKLKKIFKDCKDFYLLPEQDEQFNKQYKDLINEYRFVDLIEAHKTKRKIKAHDYLLFYSNYLTQYNQRKIKLIMYDQWSAKDIKYEDNKCENVIYGTYLLLRWYRSGLYNAYDMLSNKPDFAVHDKKNNKIIMVEVGVTNKVRIKTVDTENTIY